MLELKDLPDTKVLKRFARRYPDADVDSVIQFLTILRVASDLSSKLDEFLLQRGLLQGRWWVLILLMREQTLTSSPSLLAEKAGVSRATMTGLLDGLQKDGLVQRLVDTADRRKCTVQLTQAGQDKLDQIMPDYYRRVKKLMGVLQPDTRASLIEQLKVLQANQGVFGKD